MNNYKGILVFDLDGTVFSNFFERDREIIKEITKDNKIVLVIDAIARKVNKIGIIKNTTAILNLRLFIYSLFTNRSYSKLKAEYIRLYIKEANKSIKENDPLLQKLEKVGYNIVIISNNLFSSSISSNYELITSKSKFSELELLADRFGVDIKYVIGDNFFDDIVSASLLDIETIYIGNRILGKYSRKVTHFVKDFKQAVDLILIN